MTPKLFAELFETSRIEIIYSDVATVLVKVIELSA